MCSTLVLILFMITVFQRILVDNQHPKHTRSITQSDGILIKYAIQLMTVTIHRHSRLE
jgi:hypothetical protein